MQKYRNGFTLIELIMVIVLLGLLAIVAIPKYYDLSSSAKAGAEKGVVGAVRSGIYTYFANHSGAYPGTDGLDAATVAMCSGTNKCFANVLDQGGITQDWNKTAAGVYKGPAGNSYTYNSASGNFT